MEWFQTTSVFWSHPKVWALKDRPFRVLVSGWGFAAQHNTGGRINRVALEQIRGKPSDAAVLVAAGLWHEDGRDGWVIHEWFEHQKGAIAHEKKKQGDRDRMRQGRATVARPSRDGVERPSRVEEKRIEENTPLPPSDEPEGVREGEPRRGRTKPGLTTTELDRRANASIVNGRITHQEATT